MGILDEAIRDHLELKRKGGTREADLRRLEDEAFGDRGLPGEPASGVAVPTQAPESPESESAPGQWPDELSEADASEEGDVPEAEAPPGAQVAFHDFAAEEGLVGPRADAASPVEEEEMAPAPPTDEIAFDDSEPQEMPTELRAPGEGPPADAAEVEETEIDYDLELTLDDEDLEPSGGLREGTEEDAEGGEPPSEPELTVVEEEEEVVEGEIEEIEVDEPGGEEAPGDEGEDVLEETPDFLRETPEHDRLWFEQKPPKDFDFDD